MWVGSLSLEATVSTNKSKADFSDSMDSTSPDSVEDIQKESERVNNISMEEILTNGDPSLEGMGNGGGNQAPPPTKSSPVASVRALASKLATAGHNDLSRGLKQLVTAAEGGQAVTAATKVLVYLDVSSRDYGSLVEDFQALKKLLPGRVWAAVDGPGVLFADSQPPTETSQKMKYMRHGKFRAPDMVFPEDVLGHLIWGNTSNLGAMFERLISQGIFDSDPELDKLL